MLRLLRGYAFAIAGIAIGVAGVVALGAMSERIVRFIEGGDRFVLGQISVAGRGMGMGAGFTAGGLLPAATIKKISSVPGVAGVQPQVMLPLDPSTSQFMTLTQELILGLDLSVPMPNRYYRALPVRAGRFLRTGDRRAAVVGAAFAASRGLGVGSRFPLESAEYGVVGILERMLTAPDRFVFVPIEDAREQWVAKDRMLRTLLASGAAALTAADLNTGVAVGWREGEDPDAVARRIMAEVPDVNVQLPSELSRLLRASTAFFAALLVGIGALALVIGGLSLAKHADVLLGVERIAARPLEQDRLRLGGQQRPLAEGRNQHGGLVVRERRERDRCGVELAPDPSRPSFEELEPGGTEDEHRNISHPVDELFDEVQEALVGPLDVLEDEHEGSLLGERLEEAPPSGESLLARAAR